MSRQTGPRISSAERGSEVATQRARAFGAAAALALILAVLGWLGWAIFRDFWVLVNACLQP
jgi:hypothetical protein